MELFSREELIQIFKNSGVEIHDEADRKKIGSDYVELNIDKLLPENRLNQLYNSSDLEVNELSNQSGTFKKAILPILSKSKKNIEEKNFDIFNTIEANDNNSIIKVEYNGVAA